MSIDKEKQEKISRLEVINHAKNDMRVGRVLALYREMGDFQNVELDFQDGGRTLKIFLVGNAQKETE
jgi:hypothetical protein